MWFSVKVTQTPGWGRGENIRLLGSRQVSGLGVGGACFASNMRCFSRSKAFLGLVRLPGGRYKAFSSFKGIPEDSSCRNDD